MVAFTVDYSGTVTADDQIAARHAIFLENRRRSLLTPPVTPLLFSTPAELKASYLSILTSRVTARHLTNVSDAKSEVGISQRFTLAQVETIHGNLVARLNAGSETAAQIVSDTAA